MAESTERVSTRLRVHRERKKRGDQSPRIWLTAAESRELSLNGYFAAGISLNEAIKAYATDRLAADIEARAKITGC